MWDSSDDVLDLDTTPEMKRAAELLTQAGETIAMDLLPLKRLEALCSVKCFDKIRDPWGMSSGDKSAVMACTERCEEPLEAIGMLMEDERNKMLDGTTSCLERCRDEDEVCANRCITESISSGNIQSMISRVRARITGYKYS